MPFFEGLTFFQRQELSVWANLVSRYLSVSLVYIAIYISETLDFEI